MNASAHDFLRAQSGDAEAIGKVALYVANLFLALARKRGWNVADEDDAGSRLAWWLFRHLEKPLAFSRFPSLSRLVGYYTRHPSYLWKVVQSSRRPSLRQASGASFVSDWSRPSTRASRGRRRLLHDNPDISDAIEDHRPGPLELLCNADWVSVILRAVPKDKRDAVVARMHGASWNEIARWFGKTPRSWEVAWYKIKKQLRKRFKVYS